MSRDSGGNYTLPNAAFVPGTVISSSTMNSNFTDLSSEITNSLDRNGKGGMLARLRGVDGTSALPAYAFTSETTLGMYRAGSGDLRFSSNGTDWLTLTTSLITSSRPLTVSGALVASSTLAVTSDLTVDTSTLKVDATNNRVGIGTASPSALLAIGHAGVVDANVPVQMNAAAAGEAYYGVNKAGAAGFLVGFSNGGAPGTGAVIRTVANDPLLFYVNNTTRVGEWTSTGLNLSSMSNPSSSTAFTNTITPTNIAKAWANVTTDGAGNATINDGFNVASASIVGTDLAVTIAGDFANVTYVAICQAVNAIYTCYAVGKAVGSTTWRAINPSTLATKDLSTDALTFDVVWFGAQ